MCAKRDTPGGGGTGLGVCTVCPHDGVSGTLPPEQVPGTFGSGIQCQDEWRPLLPCPR